MNLSGPELQTVLRCVDKVFDFRAERDRLRDILATLEAENNALRARVSELEARCKRLEEAGDRLEWRIACGCGQGGPCRDCADTLEAWQQAKEAKP